MRCLWVQHGRPNPRRNCWAWVRLSALEVAPAPDAFADPRRAMGAGGVIDAEVCDASRGNTICRRKRGDGDHRAQSRMRCPPLPATLSLEVMPPSASPRLYPAPAIRVWPGHCGPTTSTPIVPGARRCALRSVSGAHHGKTRPRSSRTLSPPGAAPGRVIATRPRTGTARVRTGIGDDPASTHGVCRGLRSDRC